jgi:hypothetical protein
LLKPRLKQKLVERSKGLSKKAKNHIVSTFADKLPCQAFCRQAIAPLCKPKPEQGANLPSWFRDNDSARALTYKGLALV